MVKSPPNIQKNSFNILRNTGIFPHIFRMFCIFQYYPEKHDCIFRNIRLIFSVWDSIFQNIKISRKIQRNIQRNLQIFRNILPVFFRIFFKNPVLYCRIFRNIPRFLRAFLVFPTGFFFLDFIILDRIFQDFAHFPKILKNTNKFSKTMYSGIFVSNSG